ncbi:MAG: hypothetical protein JO060_00285, partial [Candidatus Eremiobacteraeota bacterium]|nr:hypothetical protein [Candidatus Eremiobacteraeota bacterium]
MLAAATAFPVARTPSFATAAVPTAATPTTAEAIYLHAVRAMRARSQPKFVIFHEDVKARNLGLRCSGGELDVILHHGDAKKSFRVWLRGEDGEDAAVDLATNERCDGASFIEPISNQQKSEDMFVRKPTPSPSATPQSDMRL